MVACDERGCDRCSVVRPLGGITLRIGTRSITVDIAFGGQFYAIADSEAIGISIDMANAAALVRMGREIKDAIESTRARPAPD